MRSSNSFVWFQNLTSLFDFIWLRFQNLVGCSLFILEESLAQGCEFGDIESSVPGTFLLLFQYFKCLKYSNIESSVPATFVYFLNQADGVCIWTLGFIRQKKSKSYQIAVSLRIRWYYWARKGVYVANVVGPLSTWPACSFLTKADDTKPKNATPASYF